MPKNPDRRVRETSYDSHESNKDGAIRELLATKLLMEQGFTVNKPNIDVRYDLLAEKHPKYLRVQVKNLKLEHMASPEYPQSVNQYTIHAFSRPHKYKSVYTKDDCDVILGISAIHNHFAIVPVELLSSSGKINFSSHPDSKGYKYFNTFAALSMGYSSI